MAVRMYYEKKEVQDDYQEAKDDNQEVYFDEEKEVQNDNQEAKDDYKEVL
jgi:hypothetical protein